MRPPSAVRRTVLPTTDTARAPPGSWREREAALGGQPIGSILAVMIAGCGDTAAVHCGFTLYILIIDVLDR
jgi:hypothetical protein